MGSSDFSPDSILFDLGSPGVWGSIIAGAVFGTLGGFLGGLSSLGPPAAQGEPRRRQLDEGNLVEGDRPTDI